MKIVVLGDIHAEWDKLNSFIANKRPDLILQTGDFGYWPAMETEDNRTELDKLQNRLNKSWKLHGVKNVLSDGKVVPLHWADGNHEDHFSLEKLREANQLETQPGVFYQPRGSTITLSDGRVVLFMGGADSIDKQSRIIGYDWFPSEVISLSDFQNLPDCKVDIVISHTNPLEFKIFGLNDHRGKKQFDPSCYALSRILEIYHPTHWYFSHYHVFQEGFTNNCKWTCLNRTSQTGWWKWLGD